jgi:hypothetical protein
MREAVSDLKAAIPALTKSGYQTFLPDSEGSSVWTANLKLARASSQMLGLFREVLSLAGELGAMDILELGADESRPEAEVIARRTLEAAFDDKSSPAVQLRRLTSAADFSQMIV